MLRDLLTQEFTHFFFTDFGYPRAFRFRKHHTSTNFFQNLKIILKMWLKWATIGNIWQNFHFWSIFTNFIHIYEVNITFWKKLVEGSSCHNLFSIWYFLILHALGLGLRFFCENFWVNKSLSMMCPVWYWIFTSAASRDLGPLFRIPIWYP
jgi:hypothetical protein